MNVTFLPRGWDDYLHWQSANPKLAARVNLLLEDMRRSPFRGIGKPEPLRENLSGWWSRRIDPEHRLIYRIVGKGEDRRLEIASCRYHY